MPTVLAKDGWTQIGTDSFGEFGFRELLDHHIDTDQARRAAAGWDGDRFLLLKKGETNAHALLWVSVWDSQEDATEARETLASIFDTSIQLSQSKTRLAAIWEHGAPLPRALLQGLLKNAKADELRDFNTVVQRGTRK